MTVALTSLLSERLEKNQKLRLLYDRAHSIEPIDQGHDFSHIERVSKLTAEIFLQEVKRCESRDATPAELDACFAVGLLHDCVPVAKNSPLRKDSSRLASEKAREWLNEIEFAESKMIDTMVGAILDHSFSAGRVPQSLLGESLQDADRLEALGALGLYRTVATGVAMGTALFDPFDPWAENRALDDRRFTLDHFFTKLLKLPATFRTQTAKGEAESRAQFLILFLDQLRHEITSSG